MGVLSELSAAPRSDIFPGWVVSPPTLGVIAEAETEFERRYLRGVAEAVHFLPEPLRDKVMLKAAESLRDAPFAFGSPLFNATATTVKMIPFLTYLLLKVRHGDKASEAKALELIDAAGTWQAKGKWIATEVLEMWGFPKPGSAPNEAAPPAASGPTGGASSSSSPTPPPGEGE